MEKKTVLYDCHIDLEGKMIPFGGYLMPVQYKSGVIKEHMAVRKAAGLFDVSHMGEVILKGSDALNNIQKLVTNDCSLMVDGQVKYSPMCNQDGGVIDDLLIYRIGKEEYLLVINAANRYKDIDWIRKHLFGDVRLSDISDETALLALQGPLSKSILTKLTDEKTLPIKYYTFKENVDIGGIKCMVSKTGYTGEEGYEIYCKNKDAVSLWELLLDKGSGEGLIPCGLGARDTLRLEAGLPLYGHEMDDSISPIEAGLGFAVKLNKEDFIGKQGIIDRGEPTKIRVGLKITGRGIAREDCPVFYGDKEVGRTTSGTHSPYLGYPIAMAYVDLNYKDVGTNLMVEIRGRKTSAEIVPLPFYKKS
ncbi:glycine cleavage system aminomethyltransferase GcvT [Herbinix luporum]|uniref:Aminomethyltransferase n=1 Tax=Herbinix luporum TaxID=1679721 RepID=A0A0K8J745_9FIRM|nr:glycine cleavage system aminomethyltransferase GcvT [Herbinix luporum]MDI9488042.1 glycine cleavage system aminomethyltransferase GcvT [Bacillota bacterium]CUH93360.1 Aminomethyltransferase [Herbinix luporum]HHT56205.1 glycine cleavage system aminomethyltransferase GcvT [Herbinix luporum]